MQEEASIGRDFRHGVEEEHGPVEGEKIVADGGKVAEVDVAFCKEWINHRIVGQEEDVWCMFIFSKDMVDLADR